MKSSTMVLLSVTFIFCISWSSAVAQGFSLCPQVVVAPREQAGFSGTIVFWPRSDSIDDPFFFHNVGENVSQPFPLEGHDYAGLSPNHEWVLTYKAGIWLSSLDSSQSVLHLDATGIGFREPYWINNESIFVRWNGEDTSERDSRGQLRYPYRESMVIYPFETPMRMSFPGSRLPRPIDNTLAGFSPDMQLMLLFNQDFTYYVYDPNSGQGFSIPLPDEQGRLFAPQWLNDGSLAYTATTAYIESVEGYQQEIFVSRYPFETSEQLTDLGEEFGAVEFSGTGGVRLNWSPDSRYVIFNMEAVREAGARPAENLKLYVYDRTTDITEHLCIFTDQVTGTQNYTGNELFASSFYWSPDSRFVAFEHEGVVYAFDVAEKRLITLLEDVLTLYDWK